MVLALRTRSQNLNVEINEIELKYSKKIMGLNSPESLAFWSSCVRILFGVRARKFLSIKHVSNEKKYGAGVYDRLTMILKL